MSRWDILPISEQEQKYLASTTTTVPPAVMAPLKKSLSGLIRQEISDAGQNICYYRTTINTETPIPYMCDLGCCNHGCCTVADLAARSNSFGWAIGLLCIVLITIIFALLAILAVYIMNKQKDKMHKQQLSDNSIETSSVSQISGPTNFYHHDSYYQPMRRAAGAHVRSNRQKNNILASTTREPNRKLAPSLKASYVKSLSGSSTASAQLQKEALDLKKIAEERLKRQKRINSAEARMLRKRSIQRGESPRSGLMPCQIMGISGLRSSSDYGIMTYKQRLQEHRKLSDYGLTPPTTFGEYEVEENIKRPSLDTVLPRTRKTWKERLNFIQRLLGLAKMRKSFTPPSILTIPEESSDDDRSDITEEKKLKKSITFCETTKDRLKRSFRRGQPKNAPVCTDERGQEKVTKRRNSVFVKRGSVSMEPIKKIDLEEVYTVYKQLGTGRFGFVKLAEHKQSKQKIAIKFFPRPQTKQVDFIREYNYSFFLSPHQHIIDTYEGMFSSSNDAAFFFVQEFCPRASLREAVEATNQQGLGEANTKKVFAAVLSAVEFMHNENLVHRNLKAENILIFDAQDYSKVKVTDFGLTRKVDAAVKYLEYHNYYHAPELCETVVNEVLTVNRSIDIFSLGVIFFYCIRGRFPWAKASIMCKAYWEWEQWLKRKNPALPKKWVPFSEKALKLMKKTLTPRIKDRWTAKDMRKCIAKEKLLKPMKADTSANFVYHSTEFGKGIPKSDSGERDTRKKSTLQHWISTTLSTMAEISEQVVSARDD